ncbi:hypothetical protein FE784_19695 [Paenibacillus hemerocallicola]|uniref:Uncharacterized protein n=1 Tax=Paenibacillus hemerocallicola TaxID=1172614 RepID=A0A5C4T6Q5_9BACL|nr:hypothetical protein [Paenibacillus hemerocallicola]TNJ64505.1 hypothetical protein FE784_19695 [Paenibacillus hemerocallicola]
MRKTVSNERGGALLYVLFVLALLAVLLPPLLNMIGSRFLSDKALANRIGANQLASSAMEAFFAYLNATPANGVPSALTWNSYVGNYGGWTYAAGGSASRVSITRPDGSIVTYSQVMCADSACSTQVSKSLPAEVATSANRYFARITVVAGDANGDGVANDTFSKASTITRPFPIRNKQASAIIDPDTSTDRYCIPVNGQGVLYGSAVDPHNQPHSQNVPAIQDAISAYLDSQVQKNNGVIAGFVSAAESCETWKGAGQCRVADIKAMYDAKAAASGSGPVVIRVAELLSDNIWYNEVQFGSGLGTVQRPLILVVDSIGGNMKKLSGTLTGTLIVNGNANFQGDNMNLTIRKGKNAENKDDYGGLYVKGNQYFTMSTTLVLDGVNYTGGNMTFVNGTYNFTAKSVTIQGIFSVQSSSFSMNTNGGTVTIGDMSVSNATATVNTVNGDLFVKNNLYSSGANTNVSVGGVAGVGGQLNFSSNNGGSVTANGTGTTVNIPGVTGSCTA